MVRENSMKYAVFFIVFILVQFGVLFLGHLYFLVVNQKSGEKWQRVGKDGEGWGNFCLASSLVRNYIEVK